MELTPPFTVICINDKNRPPEIPSSKWLSKGNEYTVIEVGKTLDNQPGFKLKEIQLDKSNFPYDCFSIHRFGIPQENLSEADEAVQELLEESLSEQVI